MRAGAVAAAVSVALIAGCTGGGGERAGGPTTTSTGASSTSSTAPATTTPTVTTTAPATDPPGSVTLSITAFSLPDTRAGGTGLRVLVRAGSGPVRVRRRGGGGAVAVCPATGPTTPVTPAECTDLAPTAVVDVDTAAGVELRAPGPDAAVDEVGITWVPIDRTTTIVTPARPPAACAATPCDTTFSMTPPRPGAFVLDARPGGGRPRFVLSARPSNRMVATVEGGGILSIRGTLEAGEEATLLHHEQGAEAVPAVTADISWP